MRSPESLRAVLFDLDGTLIDSEPVMRQAFAAAHAAVGAPGEAPVDAFLTHLGRPFPDILARLGLPLAMWEPFRRFSNEMMDQLALVDGIENAMDALASMGVRFGLVTGKDAERTRLILQHLQVEDRFDVVVTPECVRVGKPHPESVRHALRALGVGAPAAAFVGDSAIDMECARRGNVLAVAALWLDRPGDQAEALADVCVRRPTELVAALLGRDLLPS